MGKDKWIIFRGEDGDWWWRRTAPNGEVVGASTEGYRNMSDCMANAERNGWDPDEDGMMEKE